MAANALVAVGLLLLQSAWLVSSFNCTDGSVIDDALECDGKYDCVDFSDEKNGVFPGCSGCTTHTDCALDQICETPYCTRCQYCNTVTAAEGVCPEECECVASDRCEKDEYCGDDGTGNDRYICKPWTECAANNDDASGNCPTNGCQYHVDCGSGKEEFCNMNEVCVPCLDCIPGSEDPALAPVGGEFAFCRSGCDCTAHEDCRIDQYCGSNGCNSCDSCDTFNDAFDDGPCPACVCEDHDGCGIDEICKADMTCGDCDQCGNGAGSFDGSCKGCQCTTHGECGAGEDFCAAAGNPGTCNACASCGVLSPVGDLSCPPCCNQCCDNYCSIAMSNCVGDNELYADNAACQTACAGFPEGTAADQAGSTLGCRIYHATAAAGDAALHCPHAAYDGAGVCGDLCDAYCNDIITTCSNIPQYDDLDACLTACDLIPTDGMDDDTTGNTIQCRVNQLLLAHSNVATYCPNSGAESTEETCGEAIDTNTCDNYCELSATVCTEANALFANAEDCMATCANYPVGTADDASGNTRGCRISHLVLAENDAATHCPHASFSGAGVCGNLCDAYCHDIQITCTGEENEQYMDESECSTACDMFATDGVDNTATGNNIQCRVSHLMLAHTDPATQCPHAGDQSALDTCGGDDLNDGTQTCTNYCNMAMGRCTDGNAIFDTFDLCMFACEGYPVGTAADTSGSTRGCRISNLVLAEAEPDTHCPSVSYAGAGVCGDVCDAYCNDIMLTCSGTYDEFVQYADFDACVAACDMFPDDGQVGDSTGDTLQCRLLHLSEAHEDAAVHCPPAGEASTPETCGEDDQGANGLNSGGDDEDGEDGDGGDDGTDAASSAMFISTGFGIFCAVSFAFIEM